MAKVSIYKGGDRYQNILAVLKSLEENIKRSLVGKKKIVIKPNLCVPVRKLAVTHPEAVRAVLDFLKSIGIDQKITIAEAPFAGTLKMGLAGYGYTRKLKGYDVEFIDLNNDQTETFSVRCLEIGLDLKLELAKTVLDADYIISLAPPKTHDTVVTTLGIKNVAVGVIIGERRGWKVRNGRGHIHGGYAKTNYIIARVAEKMPISLNILDGFKAMQGNGPVQGFNVDWQIALAGLDPVAVDAVTSYMMGFNPDNIGYLYLVNKWSLGEINKEKIEIVGNADVKKNKIEFKPHNSYQNQLTWQNDKNNFN